MNEAADLNALLARIRAQARAETLRVTAHAQQEMVEEDLSLDDVMETIANARVIEHYPQHRRGPCCLLSGAADSGRPVHVVCTTERPILVIITVYEPKPPKWPTPYRRDRQ
jgi:hypothetical protein